MRDSEADESEPKYQVKSSPDQRRAIGARVVCGTQRLVVAEVAIRCLAVQQVQCPFDKWATCHCDKTKHREKHHYGHEDEGQVLGSGNTIELVVLIQGIPDHDSAKQQKYEKELRAGWSRLIKRGVPSSESIETREFHDVCLINCCFLRKHSGESLTSAQRSPWGNPLNAN